MRVDHDGNQQIRESQHQKHHVEHVFLDSVRVEDDPRPARGAGGGDGLRSEAHHRQRGDEQRERVDGADDGARRVEVVVRVAVVDDPAQRRPAVEAEHRDEAERRQLEPDGRQLVEVARHRAAVPILKGTGTTTETTCLCVLASSYQD